ncbi:MAG: DNA mismatch repair endonuclease MutL [Cryomorphaceae bacterium]
MADIIKLLPDSLANQIAAGEVIQRPASVVKELLENSVDSKATHIQLILKESGRNLIQVVDDGNGMSEADARMSLERHATSKISTTEDLFRIRTMGFRGEALASIAAVAQLEMKSRPESRKVGTHLLVEASKVKFQEACAHEQGTTISVKNLFFNVPVRRKFLKSDAVEMRHIIDEFQRVALVNKDIEFKLYHNDQQLFFLPKSNLRQRITNIFGKSYNEKVVPVEEDTDLVSIRGFIGKPEAARKTRGEQFLFVNGRYFKSSYFHAAIQQAFEGLIPPKHHASYFIYFNVDPESIDVNIHPTKTEIKFEDERSIYAIVRSAVKRSIGQYHVSPSLDFDKETHFDYLPPKEGSHIPAPGITVDKNFNPFEQENKRRQSNWERGSSFQRQHPSSDGWEKLYEGLNKSLDGSTSGPDEQILELEGDEDNTIVRQIGLKYILVQSSEGIFLIHQYRAHMRILFEAFERSLTSEKKASQQMLFPSTIELSKQDANLLASLTQPLVNMGFEIESFGGDAFIIRAVPAVCTDINIEEVIGGFIDDLRSDKPTDEKELMQRVIRSMAQQSAIKSGKAFKAQEMLELFRSLMRCGDPQHDLTGRPTFVLMNAGMLDKIFD